MSTQELKVDNEFAALIPPLTDDEYSRLEQSILAESCREPIFVWNDTFIDGHNHYKICTEHEISYETVSKDFEDRNTAMLWMLHNQLVRRNLNNLQRIEIVSKYENAVKAQAKLHQRGGQGDILLPEILPEANRNEARDELGAMAGVSGKTYQHATAVLDNAPQPVLDAARNHSISTNSAYEITKLPQTLQLEIAERIENGKPAKLVISEVKSRIRKSKQETTANTANNVPLKSVASETSLRNEEQPQKLSIAIPPEEQIQQIERLGQLQPQTTEHEILQ